MQIACENIDRVQCLEIQGRGLPRGVKGPLYEAARVAEGRPLVLAAAELLDRPSCRIGIVSGAAVPDHMPVGENDGPFGTVVLAKALTHIGHKVSIYTDPPSAEPFRVLLERKALAVPVVELALHVGIGAMDLPEAVYRVPATVGGVLMIVFVILRILLRWPRPHWKADDPDRDSVM